MHPHFGSGLWVKAMPHSSRGAVIGEVESHSVDLEGTFYSIDKATVVHVRDLTCLTSFQVDALRCFALPKLHSYKLVTTPSQWVVQGVAESITLPKLVSFNDGRDDCIALFFRSTPGQEPPRVVCARPPFEQQGNVFKDGDLAACKLSSVASFAPIKNNSGGSLLTIVNKYLASSSIFKHHKLSTVKSVVPFVNSADAKKNIQNAFQLLELTLRRQAGTTRVGQKDPRAREAVEDNNTELHQLQEQLKQLATQKPVFEAMAERYVAPLAQRILSIPTPTPDDCESFIADALR